MTVQPNAELSSWGRFGDYLRAELAFYPGRFSLIVRIVVACTLSMMLIMVFRIPGAALGAYYPMLLSRDSPRATFNAALRTSVVCTVGTAELLLGAMLLIADPFTHLLWVFGNLLLVFFLISALESYDAAVAFGFMVTTAIAIWDMPVSADARVTRTLFALLSIVTGCAVSVLVEYLFAQRPPQDPILQGIRNRLEMSGAVLKDLARRQTTEPQRKALLQRTVLRGAGDLRERLAHAEYDEAYREQLAAALSLSTRLIELAVQLYDAPPVDARDAILCGRIATNIEWICIRLGQQETPEWIELALEDHHSLPLVVEMERTVELIAESFHTDLDASSHGLHLPEPGQKRRRRFLSADAWSNRDHLKFALRGMMAASVCYLVYMSVGWNALGAAVATCVLTALRVTGAGRHKQLLRFSGVFIGACVLGVISQVILFPQIDSIQAFALLFAAVIAIGAWVGTSSPRIAYSGAQIVLAYDLVTLNSFAINPSLVPARDAILGILMGSAAMWLVFDRVWTKSASDAMRELFLAILRNVARLDIDPLSASPAASEARLWAESENLTRSFDELRAMVDFSLFEARVDSDEIFPFREIVLELQPQLRALMMVKSGLLHHQVVTASDAYREEAEESERVAREHLLEAAILLNAGSVTAHDVTGPRVFPLQERLRALLTEARIKGRTEDVTGLRLCISLVALSQHARNVVRRAVDTEAAAQEQGRVA